MCVISEGVKGLLRARRESLVTWALRTLALSERRARGLIGVEEEVGGRGRGGGEVGLLRVVVKVWRRDFVVWRVCWRVLKEEVDGVGGIFGFLVE